MVEQPTTPGIARTVRNARGSSARLQTARVATSPGCPARAPGSSQPLNPSRAPGDSHPSAVTRGPGPLGERQRSRGRVQSAGQGPPPMHQMGRDMLEGPASFVRSARPSVRLTTERAPRARTEESGGPAAGTLSRLVCQQLEVGRQRFGSDRLFSLYRRALGWPGSSGCCRHGSIDPGVLGGFCTLVDASFSFENAVQV